MQEPLTARQQNTPAMGAEVEVSYSSEQIADKLKKYGIKPLFVLKKLRVNSALLRPLKAEIIPETATAILVQTIEDWPKFDDLNALTSHINQLIYEWLSAIEEGLPIETVLELLNCFQLGYVFNQGVNTQLSLFFYELVAETTYQHQYACLDYLINYDANTLLPNSAQIPRRLRQVISVAAPEEFVGVMSVYFQPTRNKASLTQMHADALNKQIAQTLQQCLSPHCQLFYGGDAQFDILITKIDHAALITLLAAKISRAFEEMLLLHLQSILVTPFFGCAQLKAEDSASADVYSQAKLALEEALSKQQSPIFYSDEIKQALIARNNLEIKVLDAFGSDNLTLFFQPITDIKKNRCVGAEMLLRWSDRFGYNVYPSLTIDILNKVGKGKLFTRWLINSACRYAGELIHDHQLDVYVTLNLRAEDLYDTELPHLLSQGISLWKIDPKRLILEITENGILEYNENTNTVIQTLREMGFGFALDDFGTGFSSLSRLRTMPIDIIKIDQSFVRDINTSKDALEIVQSTTLLAKSLGKEVLAEGVEDAKALAVIKKLGIHKVQGYYFAKPMDFDSFVSYAKTH